MVEQLDSLFRSFILLQLSFIIPPSSSPPTSLLAYSRALGDPSIPFPFFAFLIQIAWTVFQLAEVIAICNLPAQIHQAVNYPNVSCRKFSPIHSSAQIHAPKRALYRLLPRVDPVKQEKVFCIIGPLSSSASRPYIPQEFAYLTAFLGRLNAGDIGMEVTGYGLITGTSAVNVRFPFSSGQCRIYAMFEMLSVVLTYSIIIIQMSPPSAQLSFFASSTNFTGS